MDNFNTTDNIEQQKCEALTSNNATSDDPATYCPAKWDTLLCWPPTLAGTTANQSCPSHHYGFDNRRLAFRECWPNGTWYIHPKSHKDWSNYTTCIDQEDLEVRWISVG